jgi:hypothetical protein
MHIEGTMPMKILVSLIVKSVALFGDKADFEALPRNIQKAVIQEIDLYRREGKWLVISNMGREDYSPYAKTFVEKVLRDPAKHRPTKIKRDAIM